MSFDSFLYNMGKSFMLTHQKDKLRRRMRQAGYPGIMYEHSGLIFVISVMLSVFAVIYTLFKTKLIAANFLVMFIAAPLFFIFFGIIILFLLHLGRYIYINTLIYRRVSGIERHLPEFLHEFSTNLKAGREFWDAFEDTIDPELGPLNNDLERMAAEIRGGKMSEDVLKDYIALYDSYVIKETFSIILESYGEGGGLAELLDRIADNLETINFLKKKAVASVYNYIIFMTIVSLIIAPLLFALSFNVLVLIQDLLTRLVRSGSTYLPVYVSPIDINFDHFILFSQIAVGMIAASAAAISGIVSKGTVRGATFLIALFVSISLGVYQLGLFMVSQIFSVMFSVG